MPPIPAMHSLSRPGKKEPDMVDTEKQVIVLRKEKLLRKKYADALSRIEKVFGKATKHDVASAQQLETFESNLKRQQRQFEGSTDIYELNVKLTNEFVQIYQTHAGESLAVSFPKDEVDTAGVWYDRSQQSMVLRGY